MSELSDEALAAKMGQYLGDTVAKVEKYGWVVQGVFGGVGPQFAYTVGLSGKHLPEVIVFGLPMELAHQLLNIVAEQMIDGSGFSHGDLVHGSLEDYPLVFIRVTDTSEHFGVANALYGQLDGPIQALQLIYPDAKSHLPWEEGYDVGIELPLLGAVPTELNYRE
jgi:Domain of unknown function (DUF4262)